MPEHDDDCSVAEACTLLGWGTRTVQRHREELGGAPGRRGPLSLAAVLAKRTEILDRLDAVDKSEAKRERDRAVELAEASLRAEVSKWRQTAELERVAAKALLDAMGQHSGPQSPEELG